MTTIPLPLIAPTSISARSDTGLSSDARKLDDLTRDALDVTPSQSMGERQRTSLEALQAALEESSSTEWRNQGGQPVAASTLRYALELLRALPTGIALPDILPHPDGELAFEWFRSPRSVLTVSISPSGRLSYAGLFGENKSHGAEYFAEELPEAIALNLRRLI